MAHKIETIDEFQKRLTELGQRGLLKSLNRTSAALALDGKNMAQKNARISPRVRTGRLWGSINGSHKLTGGSIDITLKSGGDTTKAPGLGPVAYARVHEFGGTTLMSAASKTRAGVPRKPRSRAGTKRKAIKASRYLRKALDRMTKKAPGFIRPVIRSLVLDEKVPRA